MFNLLLSIKHFNSPNDGNEDGSQLIALKYRQREFALMSPIPMSANPREQRGVHTRFNSVFGDLVVADSIRAYMPPVQVDSLLADFQRNLYLG